MPSQWGTGVVRLCFRGELEVEGIVVSLLHCLQTGTVALQLEDGRVRRLLWGQSLYFGAIHLLLKLLECFKQACVFPLVPLVPS